MVKKVYKSSAKLGKIPIDYKDIENKKPYDLNYYQWLFLKYGEFKDIWTTGAVAGWFNLYVVEKGYTFFITYWSFITSIKADIAIHPHSTLYFSRYKSIQAVEHHTSGTQAAGPVTATTVFYGNNPYVAKEGDYISIDHGWTGIQYDLSIHGYLVKNKFLIENN